MDNEWNFYDNAKKNSVMISLMRTCFDKISKTDKEVSETKLLALFQNILKFILSKDAPPLDSSECRKVNFSDYLKDQSILDEIISQIVLFGKIMPGDRFYLAVPKPDNNTQKSNEQDINSDTEPNKNIPEMYGHIDYLYKDKSISDYIFFRLASVESSMEIFFIADISQGFPLPNDKVFAFFPQIPDKFKKIESNMNSSIKLSFIDILSQFGYSALSEEFWQFERSSYFYKKEGRYFIEKLKQTFLFSTNLSKMIFSTGINLKSNKKQQETLYNNNKDVVCHHIHPKNYLWPSIKDILMSMNIGVPLAISGENGEGYFYQPRFSRLQEDTLIATFKLLIPEYRAILSELKQLDDSTNLIYQFNMAFLSKFFHISKYKIPKPVITQNIENVFIAFTSYFNKSA
ncbi:MAG: hypothetical protein ACD_79C00785G0001 [uncultured bacterium]|nr:MAG: hypothetical protein ACD_79C00785G0001 [uncultured bacterium]